jgi:membrane fusion protein (multidrug efflux system)
MKAIGLISSVAFVLGLSSVGLAQSAKTNVPSVVVAKVERRDVDNLDEYVARVSAVTTVNLQARVTGFLEKRNFTEGGFVKKGDLLYQIEKASYAASVAKSKADVEGAQATEKNAELYLERQKKLLTQGDVPQATVDSATAALGADKAATNKAKADLDSATIDLGYTDIFSPLDGRIGISAVDVGNVVGPESGTLATINSVDPIHVVFYISEPALLDERRQGLISKNSSTLTATITLADGKKYPSTGTVEYVDIEVQEATDTIELRASFPNPDGVLLPGQFVTVGLTNPDAKAAVTVPQTALQLDKDGHFVFMVDDKNTVQRRNVKLGKQIAGSWQVESGLKEGERVIVQGLQKVHEGVEVKPVGGQSQPG